MESFHDAKAENIRPTNDTYIKLLSLVAGLGDQGSSSGPIREIEPPNDYNAAQEIYHDMKKLDIPLSESCYTAMIRCYCLNNRPSEALELYHELKSKNISAKLRTFSTLLQTFALLGDINVCFSLYNDMINIFLLTLTEREYTSMLRVTIICKDNRFYEILNQFTEDILIPTKPFWSVVSDWFIQLDIGYKIAESSVNEEGIIELTNDKLLSIDLNEETRMNLLQQIESFALTRAHTRNIAANTTTDSIPEAIIATENSINETSKEIFNESNETKAKQLNLIDKNSSKWNHFKLWLLQTREKPFNIIIDGANIGYYKQNYLGAPQHVDYEQIQSVIIDLQELGYNPLLILHNRHLSNSTVPSELMHIIKNWKDQDLLYQTPSGWNDDWYWMYGVVEFKCHIVSNDEMRDHHFQMLQPRYVLIEVSID